MTTTPHGQVPEALRLADEFRECLECDAIPSIIDIEKAEAELRRLHAENERLSCLCDKWNSECDDFREDNKRLAADLAASPTPPAEQQAKDNYIKLLADCRDAFPVPEHGSPIENEWIAAVGSHEAVPAYLQAVAKQQAAPKAAQTWPSEDLVWEALQAYLKHDTNMEGMRAALIVGAAPQQEAPKAAPGEPVNGWPVEATIYKRRDEWVLELSGTINDCAFTCRHTQPGYLQPEDVAGLPSLYSEGIAPQQEVSQDTMYLLRRLLSNQHTLTGPEFRAELEKIVGEAYQQEAQEPYAYAVYFPDQPKVELVHDLDELIDDFTNRPHVVTKLYTAPRPAPECHHRPPCEECAAIAAQGGK